ncbi:MAG: hypothetical protein A2X59_08620 [Nitrospirae bacterium GWC2_42_7]|nr:MAG: hypothetical protein A2X59_08620 [Nitrospirae bacterium GWC2_42_7]
MRSKKGTKDLFWLRQVSSFTASRIILTANNLRIFDHFKGRGMTAAVLSKAIKTDNRATELLLNSLTAIGLIEKKGSFYKNSPVASRHLVKGQPEYQGDILRHYSTLWENWSGLDEVIKTGLPNKKAHDHESFILGMHNLASLKVKRIIGSIDLKGIKSILDIGGGPGTYSMAFAKKKINVTLMDFSETLEISSRLIKKAGLGKMIKLVAGDFMTQNTNNTYDMVFLSQVLHSFSSEGSLSLVRKIYDTLNADGKFVLQEFYLDETKTSPPFGAIFAINMLINTKGGRTYTLAEITSFMKKAGFVNISHKIIDDTVLITGMKKKAAKKSRQPVDSCLLA